MKRSRIKCGDSAKVLKKLKDNSIDSLITDPPAGISFMNKGWDGNKGGRDKWISWLSDIMKEAYRVMKPGAHGFVWAIPRTSHWTATALEDAGFEIRDVVVHLFGSGFPKSHNVGLAIDKLNNVESPVVETKIKYGNAAVDCKDKGGTYVSGESFIGKSKEIEYKQATNEWKGWGTGLKPAAEHWILIRKPTKKTVAKQVLETGTGAINIDASRIGTEPMATNGKGNKFVDTKPHGERDGVAVQGKFKRENGKLYKWCSPKGVQVAEERTDVGAGAFGGKGKWVEVNEEDLPTGRFPANVVLSCSCEGAKTHSVHGCVCAELDAQSGNCGNGHWAKSKVTGFGEFGGGKQEYQGVGEKDNTKGGASRFFYCAKVSTKERGEGNNHPTVKPQKLMEYLITMITPPGGWVLDPFAGSGSTLIAAKRAGFKYIGIEREMDYVKIARKRLKGVK